MDTVDIDGPRACQKAEIAEVIALVDGAMRQGSSQSMLTDYPLVYREQNLPNIRILKVNGTMASVVPFIPHKVVIDDCRLKLGIISPTATEKSQRMKGYGLRCLQSCVEEMIRADVDISVLWTQIETFAFYEKVDFQAVSNQGWSYRCGPKDAERFRHNGHEVLQYNPANGKYLDDIQVMHEQEVYGVRRETQNYAALFSLPKMKSLIALHHGAAQAYLMVSEAINKPGLIEGGGDEKALETLMHVALKQLKEESYFQAYGYLTPSRLGDLLEKKMPQTRKTAEWGHMMVRINNISVFFTKIATWLEQKNSSIEQEFSLRLKDSGEVVSFVFSGNKLKLGQDILGQHREISRQELTSVIFGPHPERPVETPKIMSDLFCFYFPIWELDHS